MIIETTSPIPPARRAATRWFLPVTLAVYTVALAAIWVAMRTLGDRCWPGTLLLLAPRWPYAVPLVALVPWALWQRQWASVGLSAVAAAGALAVLGFHPRPPGAEARQGELRLITCNIHRQHLDAGRMAAFLSQTAPDVVALQGWSDLHREALFADGSWEVRHIGEILIASRWPLGEARAIPLANDPGVPAGEQGAAVLVDVRAPRGTIHLIALHLASPHAGLNAMWSDRGEKLAGNLVRRREESRQVRDVVDGTSGPILLAGDFNTVGESHIFADDWEGFADAFDERGSGIGYTYLVGHTQIRIDHVLADASWDIRSCWVGPDVSAAHRPLVVDLDFR